MLGFLGVAGLVISIWLLPFNASALDAKRAAMIKIYGYDYIDLKGPNATTVLAHTAAVVSYCSKLTQFDNGAEKMLRDLSRPLRDPQPEVSRIVAVLGASGNLGDSTGAVPTAPITEIARLKGISPLQFCRAYTRLMKREAERYRDHCKLRDDKQSYVCSEQ